MKNKSESEKESSFKNFRLLAEAKKGNIEEVQRLVREGADVNWSHSAALQAAIIHNHEEIAIFLVLNGAKNPLRPEVGSKKLYEFVKFYNKLKDL